MRFASKLIQNWSYQTIKKNQKYDEFEIFIEVSAFLISIAGIDSLLTLQTC